MGIVERKEREREARRTAILNAAETVFKTNGFANATMDDIARQAELAKGTVYLYYKSKEELQVGLVTRGLDLLNDIFEDVSSKSQTAMGKLLTTGEAYWQFANEYPFYFTLMHIADLPYRNGQVSPEMIMGVHERSNAIWSLLVSYIDQAKAEGLIKAEVDGFAVAMLLWMNGTSILRFQHKFENTPDSLWEGRKEFNPCRVDMKMMYSLNGSILLHEIVTEEGRKLLEPIVWPKTDALGAVECTPQIMQPGFNLGPFAEEFSENMFIEARL